VIHFLRADRSKRQPQEVVQTYHEGILPVCLFAVEKKAVGKVPITVVVKKSAQYVWFVFCSFLLVVLLCYQGRGLIANKQPRQIVTSGYLDRFQRSVDTHDPNARSLLPRSWLHTGSRILILFSHRPSSASAAIFQVCVS
jgi:hypothetical protein